LLEGVVSVYTIETRLTGNLYVKFRGSQVRVSHYVFERNKVCGSTVQYVSSERMSEPVWVRPLYSCRPRPQTNNLSYCAVVHRFTAVRQKDNGVFSPTL